MFTDLPPVGPIHTQASLLPHPLNEGRVLWLYGAPPLDGGRQWLDLCGLTHGTLVAAPTWAATGRGDAGLALNGTSQEVTTNSVLGGGYPAIAVAAWVRFTALTSTFRGIVCKSSGSGAEGFFLSTGGNFGGGLTSAAQVRFRVNTDTVPGGDSTGVNAYTPVLSTGVWYRLFATWDSRDETVRLHLNGVPQTTGTRPGNVTQSSTGLLRVGNSGYGEFLPGAVSDVSVWNLSRGALRGNPAAMASLDFDLSRRGYPGVLRRAG